MFLLVDNYDSFTYNIADYVRICHEHVDIIKNTEPLKSIDFCRYAGIILSPGPSTPENSALSLDILRADIDIPLFGVCLGMQSMAYAYGGRIIHAKRTMHGKLDSLHHTESLLFSQLPAEFRVVRYHSLAVDRESLPDDFRITALSSDDEIMAMEHTSKALYGVQFHPESYCTDNGLKIIQNFIGAAYAYQNN